MRIRIKDQNDIEKYVITLLGVIDHYCHHHFEYVCLISVNTFNSEFML